MRGIGSSISTRPLLAAIVLGSTWVVLGAVLWVIMVVEPVVIPRRFYIPGLGATILFGVVLVASKASPMVWRASFVPTIDLPRWAWLSAPGATILVLLLSSSYSMSASGAIASGVFVVASSYIVALASPRTGLKRSITCPIWLVLAVGLLVALVVGLTIFVEEGTLLSTVFLIALLLFAFHVLVILPLTLYEYTRPTPHRPDSYPVVTVLIPAYNEEGYVGECLETVLASSYPTDQLEVIVIDDGSTDGTYQEARSYRDAGVKLFQRDNGGKHAALNFGLQCAAGSVIATVDADSRPEPTAIERMVAALLDDPAIGGLSASVLAANDDSTIGKLQRVEYTLSNTNRRAYSMFDAVPVVPGCLGIYRRRALEEVWGYDPDTVTEDFDITIKLLKAGWRVNHGPGLVWTIAPDEWRSLWRQRLRWYQGGFETLRKHWDVLTDPEYRHVHAISFPARFVSHLFTPVASGVILLAVLWGFLTQPTLYLVVLVLLFLLLTGLITLYSLVIESEPLHELAYAPLLFVGYKHFVDGSVAVGSLNAVAKKWKGRTQTSHERWDSS